MATWKEDTIQALKNLGGIAHRSKIFEEVAKIRLENSVGTFVVLEGL